MSSLLDVYGEVTIMKSSWWRHFSLGSVMTSLFAIYDDMWPGGQGVQSTLANFFQDLPKNPTMWMTQVPVPYAQKYLQATPQLVS